MEKLMKAYPEQETNDFIEWMDVTYFDDSSIEKIDQKKAYDRYFAEKVEHGLYLAQDPKSHYEFMEKLCTMQELPYDRPDFAIDPENLLNVWLASRMKTKGLPLDKVHRPKMYETVFKKMIANGADKYAVMAMLAKGQISARDFGQSHTPT